MNERVLKIFRQAKRMLNKQSQIKELIWKVSQKLKKINGSNKQINELLEHVQLFLRMIKKSLAGEYSGFSHKTLFSLVFGLLYFVTPMDVVPDFIPMLGFSDDLSIVYFIIKNFKSDIEDFKGWELNRESVR